MYYDKLEKIINVLKKMCEDHVEFIKYDEKILSEIKNISLCFDDCKKPYCLQKETDMCKFIIPENNLMSDKSNSTMYYAKISDELIRHYRLRSYILDQNSYLSFSKLIYNISENEIILPKVILQKNILILLKIKINYLLMNLY